MSENIPPGYGGAAYKVLTVRTSEDTRAQLEVLAQLNERSVTEETRIALEHWVDKSKSDPTVLKRAEQVRITPDDYTENKLRYDQEISRVKQQIERLEEADKSFYVTASYLLQLFKHGEKIFEVASIEEKRELLKLVLSNLELKDKTVRFTPNEPFATVLKLSERSTWQGQ